MSHRTAEESERMSQKIDQWICSEFVDGYDGFSAEEQQMLLTELDFWIRKSAHFFEYAILGAVLYLTAGFITWKTDVRIKIVFFVGILQAAGDEFHQYFVEGRNPQMRDVFLDVSGVCTGIVFILILTILLKALDRQWNVRPGYRNKDMKCTGAKGL